jgi:hypothetical protein
MAVTILKAKVKDSSVLDSLEIVTPEEVDTFATHSAKLKRKLENLAPLQEQVAQMEKSLISAADEVVDAGTPVTLTGNTYVVALSAQGKKNVIKNMDLAVEMLGEDLFLKLAKITMKDLQAYLTPDQLEQVVSSSYASKRRVKVAKLA